MSTVAEPVAEAQIKLIPNLDEFETLLDRRLDEIATRAAERFASIVVTVPEPEAAAAELAPIGMIVSEAVSNAIKHAFPGDRRGNIRISLDVESGLTRLSIRDDGTGIDGSGSRTRRGGVWLIEALAKGLGGRAMFTNDPQGGAQVMISYPRRV